MYVTCYLLIHVMMKPVVMLVMNLVKLVLLVGTVNS